MFSLTTQVDVSVFPKRSAWPAGKGVLGWVVAGPELSRSPIKPKEGPQDAKVVLGNKQMMADEGIPISKAVDDYMRDMEVRPHLGCNPQWFCSICFAPALSITLWHSYGFGTALLLPSTRFISCHRSEGGLELLMKGSKRVGGWQAKCCTCVMVAVGAAIVAVLAVTDPLKPEARGVVAALARRGLAVHLVTGDNWRTARAIAEQLAIINVCAECLPGAKADKIRVRG
jgi:hypothetical protein